MSMVTMRRCDRCRVEISAAVKYVTINLDGEKDLCAGCKRGLDRYMNGERIEDPP